MTKSYLSLLAVAAAALLSPAPASALETQPGVVEEIRLCSDFTTARSLTYYIVKHRGTWFQAGYTGQYISTGVSITPAGEYFQSNFMDGVYKLLLSSQLSGRKVVLTYKTVTGVSLCGVDAIYGRLDLHQNGVSLLN